MEAIRCEGLSRQYGRVEALQPLDLAVPQGSIFGFLGRNGAGKTTTIRLLTGLARPTTGKAWVDGIEVTAVNDLVRYRFGHLPEEPAFYTWMTPREYLHYVGRLFHLPDAELKRRVDELLELAGLTDAGRRRIAGFSRGMRQRLGLAQALIHNPPVLFLDEPASALDPAGRRDVLNLINSLRGRATVFLSSHILADIERVCDTIGIIREGRLLLVAGRDELLARYATNQFLLEVDETSSHQLDQLIPQLEAIPWITAVRRQDNQLRLTAADSAQAKQELLPLLIAQGVILNRYEWLQPSLEEVFLSLSA